MPPDCVALRGDLLDFEDDPRLDKHATRFIQDGLLMIEDGHIAWQAPASTHLGKLPNGIEVIDHRGSLIIPGMIDTHVHYPQCDMIASYGEQLLDWLTSYTFPAESQFGDAVTARETAGFFLDELIRNGTTTALVFGTVHPQSVTAFFSEAAERNMRMICGKVLMDRNAPATLLDSPEQAYAQSHQLIQQWHDHKRLGYAITPRFAPTSSAEQLAVAGRLRTEFPDVHVHTHIAESRDECAWVKELFPARRDYVDVYAHHGLLGPRTVLAHGIYLSDTEWEALAKSNCKIAHCPTSNLFIGSGLFNLHKADQHGVSVGIGTDIGGGDSFSLLRTLNEAYKVQQLQSQSLPAIRALYLATLGGARVLALDNRIGSFNPGNEADIVVLNPRCTPLLARRSALCKTLDELIFVLQTLADDRAVSHTYILGQEVKQKRQ